MTIVIHESLGSSILKDFGTIGALVSGVLLNNWLVGGSVFLNGVLVLLLFLFIAAKASGKEIATNRSDALNLVDRAFPKEKNP